MRAKGLSSSSETLIKISYFLTGCKIVVKAGNGVIVRRD